MLVWRKRPRRNGSRCGWVGGRVYEVEKSDWDRRDGARIGVSRVQQAAGYSNWPAWTRELPVVS